MPAPWTWIEIQVGGTVEPGQAFGLIFDRMGMHYVHNDSNTHRMCLVDQAFEIVRRAESGCCRVET